MEENTKLDKITAMIAENLACDAASITEETNFIEDLGADSLDVELCLAFEDEFGVHIEDEDLPNMRTVSDVLNYIEKAA